jgi:hypothetical protein
MHFYRLEYRLREKIRSHKAPVIEQVSYCLMRADSSAKATLRTMQMHWMGRPLRG